MSGIYALTVAPTCDFPHERQDNPSQNFRIFRTVLGPKHHAVCRVPVTQKIELQRDDEDVQSSCDAESTMLQPSPQTNASRAQHWAAPLMVNGFVLDATDLEPIPQAEDEAAIPKPPESLRLKRKPRGKQALSWPLGN
jgi:hypothetical protein